MIRILERDLYEHDFFAWTRRQSRELRRDRRLGQGAAQRGPQLVDPGNRAPAFAETLARPGPRRRCQREVMTFRRLTPRRCAPTSNAGSTPRCPSGPSWTWSPTALLNHGWRWTALVSLAKPRRRHPPLNRRSALQSLNVEMQHGVRQPATGGTDRYPSLFKEADEIFSHIIENMEKVYLPLVQRRIDHIPEAERIGLLFTIQNPFNKIPIPIGLATERGFAEAAEVLLRFSPFLTGRVSRGELVFSLKKSFSQIVLQHERRVDPRIAGVVLKVANILAKRYINKCTTVYFPCRFVTMNAVSPFAIGPVTFLPYPQFQTAVLPRAETYFTSNDHVFSIFCNYCADFAWVAKITIPHCSNSLAREKAERALLLALSCLKLIFSHDISHAFAPAGGVWYEKHTAVLLENLGGCFSTQVDPGRGEAWIEKHDLQEGLRINRIVLRAIGSLIQRAIEMEGELPSIYERAVKCLNWFERAVSENAPTAAILLYELSLEVLLLTKEKAKKNQICQRGSLLCSWDNPASVNRWRRELEHLWDIRGKIAHGKIASRDPKLRKDLDRVYEVASQTIANGLFWMHHVSQEDNNMSSERLNAKFENDLKRYLQRK